MGGGGQEVSQEDGADPSIFLTVYSVPKSQLKNVLFYRRMGGGGQEESQEDGLDPPIFLTVYSVFQRVNKKCFVL